MEIFLVNIHLHSYRSVRVFWTVNNATINIIIIELRLRSLEDIMKLKKTKKQTLARCMGKYHDRKR